MNFMMNKTKKTAKQASGNARRIFEEARTEATEAIELADVELQDQQNKLQQLTEEFNKAKAKIDSQEKDITSDKNGAEKVLNFLGKLK